MKKLLTIIVVIILVILVILAGNVDYEGRKYLYVESKAEPKSRIIH